jgi:hypothetical protein
MSGNFRHRTRLTADSTAFRTCYPINFVVKYRSFALCRGRPALGLLKPAAADLAIDYNLLPDRRHLNGGNLEAVNEFGGADRDRTGDPLLAKQVLSQLSYSPMSGACG